MLLTHLIKLTLNRAERITSGWALIKFGRTKALETRLSMMVAISTGLPVVFRAVVGI
jgi:hypothetical protein